MITLRKGPYGFYMQVGEGTKEKETKRVSIPKNFEPDEIGLNTAIQLLGLPRKLGFHPKQIKRLVPVLECMDHIFCMIKNIKLSKKQITFLILNLKEPLN